MTKLAKDSMPADTHSFLTDTPELAAGFSLCMLLSVSPMSRSRLGLTNEEMVPYRVGNSGGES